jgi:hypothetical protein
LATRLRNVAEVLTIVALVKCIEECYTSSDEEKHKPTAYLVQHCYDWKRFLTGDGDYEDPAVDDEEETLQAVFQATPLFTDIQNTSGYHQFKISKMGDKVVVQARENATPKKEWQPEEGCEVLTRLPDEEMPFIIQPKPLKEEEMKALRQVPATFEKSGSVSYASDDLVKEFWEKEVKYQESLLTGLQPANRAPSDVYKHLVRHDSCGKLQFLASNSRSFKYT